jgi:predicted ATPase
MISSIEFHNFKAFSDLSIPTGSLTLLSGLNGTGKSSVLQSIAMLRQSFDAAFLQRGAWLLNGELVELGTGRDVAFEDANDEKVSVALTGVHDILNKRITASSIVERQPDADVLWTQDRLNVGPAHWGGLAPFRRGFQYLRADRIVPAVTFPKSQHAVHTRRFLGPRGEFSAHYLLEYGDDDLPCPSLNHGDAAPKLLAQANAWMQEFSPGVRIEVQAIPMTDLVRLEFSYRTTGAAYGSSFRSTNVGFGLTHALPVVVASLASAPGTLIMIENPEAQLHPQGQVAVGQLLARLAAADVQVIVESHSDHVLNGIRLAVKKKNLSPEKVRFHFFQRNDAARTIMKSPIINEEGLLSEWPQGFFTQWDDTLLELLG